MSAHRNHFLRIGINVILAVSMISMLTACQDGLFSGGNTTAEPSQASQSMLPEQPRAEITFEAQTLAPFGENQNLYIEILDEVTGLALNPAKVKMEKQDAQTFIIKMPVTVGSVVKYRYIRDEDAFGYEYTSLGSQVRYRLFYVDGPGYARDTISGWKAEPLVSNTGRIQGQVAIQGTNAPVINALVAAGGMHTLTASDGSFMLEGLPAGLHNLVVYSLDGEFQPFQQGAIVAPESATPAQIFVQKKQMVNVTFNITPPADSIKGLPIRMVGNLYRLGNMFADLEGGVSTVAARAPMLAVLEDGRYTISLQLPAGLDLRYKYSLGDGFWNTERASTGDLRLRQVIIPDQDTVIDDVIDTWNTKEKAPVTFTLTTPANTPSSDQVSIQFNPYAWTTPIPMWPAGNGRWFYILYNPLDSFSSASYRFCRNDQCGKADASDSIGSTAAGKPFETKSGEQNFDEAVNSWAWLDAQTEPVVVPAAPIQVRDNTFQVGIEFLPGYHPSWLPEMGSALQNIADIGSNSIVLTPTWRFTHQTPPVIEPVPGKDALWADLIQITTQAQQKGLSIVVHPVLQYPGDPASWWVDATRNDGWWQSWFDRYRTYILYHADLAAQSGAKTLILGDETILPAIPGGVLADGSPSGVPGNADEHWRKLIAEIRTRYTGKLAWFISYNGKLSTIPDFTSDVDQLYIQISGPLAEKDDVAVADLESSVANLLDSQILPLQQKAGQPVILGLKFPSAAGALDGCVTSGDTCLPLGIFEEPGLSIEGIQPGFTDQAKAYTAVLSVVNQRSWISGFVASGYYAPVLLKDYSISMRGKPAGDVLWYWYSRLTGKVQ